jgi:SAM-dependent methyltransferase
MPVMTAADFDRRYRANPDPWQYRSSPYERAKYTATLDACGTGPFNSALELGGSIGIFSARLAPRCRALATVDYSRIAVRAAQIELAPHPHARALVGMIPEDLPDGAFDLVVASEILYYLDREAVAATLEQIERRLVPEGRLVCVHWRKPGRERPLTAADVHRQVRASMRLRLVRDDATDDYLLDTLERR